MLLLGILESQHDWQIFVLNVAVIWNLILLARISYARAAVFLLLGKKSMNCAIRLKKNP